MQGNLESPQTITRGATRSVGRTLALIASTVVVALGAGGAMTGTASARGCGCHGHHGRAYLRHGGRVHIFRQSRFLAPGYVYGEAPVFDYGRFSYEDAAPYGYDFSDYGGYGGYRGYRSYGGYGGRYLTGGYGYGGHQAYDRAYRTDWGGERDEGGRWGGYHGRGGGDEGHWDHGRHGGAGPQWHGGGRGHGRGHGDD